MQIEELWKALEHDAVAGQPATCGWLLRLARSVPGVPLFVGLELATNRRAVLLRLPAAAIPPRRLWPRAKGIEPFAATLDGDPYFGVALKEIRFADVFTALAEDLVRRTADISEPGLLAQAFIGQLARWQKFLASSSDGLSEESQRGLWGELHLLLRHLHQSMGPVAVTAWKGGERAHQDFQFADAAVEVKTTLAKQPQVVRIASERQLDRSVWSALFLYVVALEGKEGGGETLPALVSCVRTALTAQPAAAELFEDELLLSGYLDSHAARYSGRGYLIRSEKFFEVRAGFPCLVESQMPAGVGDASYSLSVAACEPFVVTEAAMLQGLGQQGSGEEGNP